MSSEFYFKKTQKIELKMLFPLIFIFFSFLYIFLYENLSKSILLLFAYIFLGFSLKLIDDAFDINSFNKRFAIFLSFPTAFIIGILTFFDVYSAIIFIPLVFSLLLIGKIDNLGFKIVFSIFLFFAIATILRGFLFDFIYVFSGMLLFFTSIIDEKLNDISNRIKNKFLSIFFYYRPIMKISVFALCFFVFPFFYFFAFLSFDFAYCFAEGLSDKDEI